MKPKSALDFLMQNEPVTEEPLQSTDTFDMAAAAAGLTAEQQKARTVRKENGVSFITLNSGRRVRFEAIYVGAEQIAEKTKVHEFNLRNQEAVTIDMCDDILPSIRKAGVKMPVLATRTEDDVLHIFDGSRRRFAALTAGCGLHVDATDEVLSDDEIAELSHITNLTKISSLYDRGRYYQLQKEKYPELSQNQLADYLGIAPSALGYALQAYEVPPAIYQIFPSKTELGRTQSQALYKLIKSLDDDAVDRLEARCKERSVLPEKFTDDKSALEYLKQLTGQVAEKKTFGEEIGKIRVKVKGTKISIEVPDAATLEEIYQLLQDKYM